MNWHKLPHHCQLGDLKAYLEDVEYENRVLRAKLR